MDPSPYPASRNRLPEPRPWGSRYAYLPAIGARSLSTLTLRERERFLRSDLVIAPGRQAREPARHILLVAGILFRMEAGERRLLVKENNEIETEKGQCGFDHDSPGSRRGWLRR